MIWGVKTKTNINWAKDQRHGSRGQKVKGHRSCIKRFTGQVAKVEGLKIFGRGYVYNHSEYIISGLFSLKMSPYLESQMVAQYLF